MRSLTTAFLLFALTLWGGGTASSAAEVAASDPDSLSRMCELGITYALSGQAAAAESAFVSLLSRSPGDARALNNLGNLSLGRGDPALALAFYAKAGAADSADAGIVLNEAAALMIAGDDSTARDAAAEGIERAGGPEPAAGLLGLKYEAPDSETRAAEGARVRRGEMLALLHSAIRSVPVDSTANHHGARPPAGAKAKPMPAWRPAGARSDIDVDVATLLYWKR